jgi:6-phospho-3-hexuloisomerase
MTTTDHTNTVIAELERTLAAISPEEAGRLCDLILQARSIFVAGAGRSGLAMKGFAMRLMHMGFSVHVPGDMVTPALQAGDLLIIGSGSGATASLVAMAEKARALNGKVAVITILPDSRIGQLADATVRIPAPSPKAPGSEQFASVQPMGTLFEQSLMIFLDLMVMRLMDKKGLDATRMFERHANLE